LSEFDDEDVTDLFDLLLIAQTSNNSFEERFNRDLLEASLEDRVHAFVSGLETVEPPNQPLNRKSKEDSAFVELTFRISNPSSTLCLKGPISTIRTKL